MRRHLPRITILALALLAAATSTAAAQKHHVHGFHQFSIYDDEAQRTFGAKPTCRVQYQRVPDAVLGAGVGADANLSTCTIRYGVAWWRVANPLQRCGLMVHELGHLLGLTHEHGNAWPVMQPEPILFDVCDRLTAHDRDTHYTWTYEGRADG